MHVTIVSMLCTTIYSFVLLYIVDYVWKRNILTATVEPNHRMNIILNEEKHNTILGHNIAPASLVTVSEVRHYIITGNSISSTSLNTFTPVLCV